VKFRVDASHRAAITGSANAGAPLRCFELKAGWRRVRTEDGTAEGYLPENLVRWR
jgi:hypothetical protein